MHFLGQNEFCLKEIQSRSNLVLKFMWELTVCTSVCRDTVEKGAFLESPIRPDVMKLFSWADAPSSKSSIAP